MQSCLNWTSLYAHYPAPWLYQHLSSITTALIRLLTVPGTYHIYQQLQNTEGNRYLVSSSGNQWLLRQHLQCLSKKLSCTEHLVFHHSKYNNNRRGKPQSCLIHGYRGLGWAGIRNERPPRTPHFSRAMLLISWKERLHTPKDYCEQV